MRPWQFWRAAIVGGVLMAGGSLLAEYACRPCSIRIRVSPWAGGQQGLRLKFASATKPDGAASAG